MLEEKQLALESQLREQQQLSCSQLDELRVELTAAHTSSLEALRGSLLEEKQLALESQLHEQQQLTSRQLDELKAKFESVISDLKMKTELAESNLASVEAR